MLHRRSVEPMKRAIEGFHLDEHDDWVATLSCGHAQHVRHRPPFTLRPWTQSAQARASMLGKDLDCVRCDRFELPEHVEHYRSTPEFDQNSVPTGLRAAHSTRRGVWGRIQVYSGSLDYHIEDEPSLTRRLDSRQEGIVVPELRHHVSIDGPVRFRVHFYRAPKTAQSKTRKRTSVS